MICGSAVADDGLVEREQEQREQDRAEDLELRSRGQVAGSVVRRRRVRHPLLFYWYFTIVGSHRAGFQRLDRDRRENSSAMTSR